MQQKKERENMNIWGSFLYDFKNRNSFWVT